MGRLMAVFRDRRVRPAAGGFWRGHSGLHHRRHFKPSSARPPRTRPPLATRQRLIIRSSFFHRTKGPAARRSTSRALAFWLGHDPARVIGWYAADSTITGELSSQPEDIRAIASARCLYREDWGTEIWSVKPGSARSALLDHLFRR